MSKKILAALLAVMMVLSLVPVTALAAVATELTVTVGTDGAVTVKSGEADQEEIYEATGTLKYAVVEADPAEKITAWTADTDESAANTDLSTTFADLTNETKLAVADNEKWIVVVDVSAESKIVAAGSAQVTGITEDTEGPGTGTNIETLNVAVDAEGTITVKKGEDVYTGTALSYYIVEESKATEISKWTTETTADTVATDLGVSAETGKPTLTTANNDKFLVVVDIANGKVVAAGQSSAIAIEPANRGNKRDESTPAPPRPANVCAGQPFRRKRHDGGCKPLSHLGKPAGIQEYIPRRHGVPVGGKRGRGNPALEIHRGLCPPGRLHAGQGYFPLCPCGRFRRRHAPLDAAFRGHGCL